MSLGTDFEMHAIWQGYIEDPAAKDFIARKAHTIALSKARGTRQSTLFTSLEIPWGLHTWAVLRSLAGLMSHEKVSVWGFFVSKKGIICILLTDVCTRNFWQKAESILLWETPCVLCQKYGGACTTYQLVVPKVRKMGQEIWFLCSQERVRRN
jgi:hypothetical protein